VGGGRSGAVGYSGFRVAVPFFTAETLRAQTVIRSVQNQT
jgi:hypothetical protein